MVNELFKEEVKSERTFFVLSALLVLTVLSFTYFGYVSALPNLHEDIYFELCSDSSCRDSRSVFYSDESYVYLRGFNLGNGEVSLILNKPDGYAYEISFERVGDSSEGVGRISINDLGRYGGVVRVSEDGFMPFVSRFHFHVLDDRTESTRYSDSLDDVGRDYLNFEESSYLVNNEDYDIAPILISLKVQKRGGLLDLWRWRDYQNVYEGPAYLPENDKISITQLWEIGGGFVPEENGSYRIVLTVSNMDGEIMQSQNGVGLRRVSYFNVRDDD